MAVPSVCTLTFPPNGWVTGAAPDGTATLTANVTTDATTPVVILVDNVAQGSPSNSDGQGHFSKSITLTTGSRAVKARAGTNPDTLDSSVATVTVTDMFATIGKATDWSMQRYLNWLAAQTVINVPDGSLYTAKDAACLWAGVSSVDYTLLGALNVKAGNTDRSLWVSVNQALNQIYRGGSTYDPYNPTLSNQNALYQIARAVHG